MSDGPIFTVLTPAATAAARRLTTAAKVQALLFGGATTDTALLEALIDRASAMAAAYCNLARDAAGLPPTFSREVCRATWRPGMAARTGSLMMPWRYPITAIGPVVADGVTLQAADYGMRGASLERLDSDGALSTWPAAGIVVDFTAGWPIPEPDAVPSEIEVAVIDQVKAMYQGRRRDPALRSETTDGVGSASYSVAGGDSIGRSGLLLSVEATLDAYRSIAV
ncbi:MAG: hypothetical protein KIS73_05130 [Enhydrobacter sp.]|nr:hypothetical protein [Enhydrobacter sp.]